MPAYLRAVLLASVLASVSLDGCNIRESGLNPKDKNSAIPVLSSTGLKAIPAGVNSRRLQMLDGSTLTLASLAGKPVVLELFASWCPTCREQMPLMTQLANDYKNRGVEVIALSIEEPAKADKAVCMMVSQNNIGYKVGWIPYDVALTFAEDLGPGRVPIPQTFVIRRSGQVAKHFTGFEPGTDFDETRRILDAELNASAFVSSPPAAVTVR